MKSAFKPVLILIAVIILLSFVFGEKKEDGFHMCMDLGPVLPTVFAIVFAFTTKNVIFSIFCGLWAGSFLFIYQKIPSQSNYINELSSILNSLGTGILRIIDTYVINGINDPDRISIILFSCMLGGMIGVVAKSGGLQAIVEKISKVAKTPKSGQLSTMFMGILIFFDDYSNTLLVGNTMRSLTDKLRISREKLAYLVDSTSAPVASLAMMSTWIGYEVGCIGESLKMAGIDKDPYVLFVQTIPYRFYAIFSLIFLFFISYLVKDFGPMFSAEKRCRIENKPLADGAHPLSSLDMDTIKLKDGTKKRWYNAMFPIILMIIITISGLYITGTNKILETGGKEALLTASLSDIVGKSNSFAVLLWSSMIGSIIAICMVVYQNILTMDEAVESWVEGCKSMIMAMIILILAWSLMGICTDLKTADFISVKLKTVLNIHYMPFVTFIFSAIIAFTTGTSWGTMAIVFPIVISLVNGMNQTLMLPYFDSILMGTIGAVLAGASFGDHCSPISDTTIMSSMSSGCDHMDHVKTQMPYALTVGVISILSGYLLIGFGYSPYIGIAIGIPVLFFIVKFFGKSTKLEDLNPHENN